MKKGWKQGRNVKLLSFKHTLATDFLNCRRNIKLKVVASGCDQCMWPVGVVTGYDYWVGD